MPDDTAKRGKELYVVEVDGVKKSEHRIFIEALKFGMELKRRYPGCKVKLWDADDNTPIFGSYAAKRAGGIGRPVDGNSRFG